MMKKLGLGKLVIALSITVALLSLFVPMSNHLVEQSVDGVSQSSYGQITEEFILTIGETARELGQTNDLYASVMIAQAILESSSGQSELSQAPYYNYFGIKGNYYGQSVNMLTWEDDGSGNVEHVYADFRAYGSPEASLSDYVALLQSPIYTGARKSNTLSYMDATAALTGLYATDTSYHHKLNDLIVQYGLTRYDLPS